MKTNRKSSLDAHLELDPEDIFLKKNYEELNHLSKTIGAMKKSPTIEVLKFLPTFLSEPNHIFQSYVISVLGPQQAARNTIALF